MCFALVGIMGNVCYKIMKWKSEKHFNEATTQTKETDKNYTSKDLSWEEKQRKKNVDVLATFVEDFTTYPENFILNMLILSTPFYKDFEQEILEFNRITQDRERHFTRKLSPFKRRVLFLGALEEIAATHVLYKEPKSSVLEMPTCSQLYIIQDNIQVIPEKQNPPQDGTEEVDDFSDYKDEGGSATIYKMIEEPIKKHPGYINLRNTEMISEINNDIIPEISSISTIQEPISNNKFIRKERNSSSTDPNIIDLDPIKIFSPQNESDEPQETSSRQENLTEQYAKNQRRLSGVLPKSFNWKEERESLKIKKIAESRSKAIFPKLNPQMEKSKIDKSNMQNVQKTGTEFDKLRVMLAKIDEEKTESKINVNKQSDILPTDIDTNSINSNNLIKPCEYLPINIRKEGFVRKKIDLTDNKQKGASNTELNIYLSSKWYLRTFEYHFLKLLKIIQKEYLYNTREKQFSAIQTTNIMDDKFGPKFTTQFIPSILVNKWPQCALEWKRRIRKTKPNNETKASYHNKWPTVENIEEIIDKGCNLIPLGYNLSEKFSNTFEIEWKIQFTNAEQILLSSLGYAQIRILLMAQLLIRDHLGENTQLRTQHLRFILFYMCECNMGDWDEERLAIKLKSFMKSLYNYLSKANFPHYFISHCNMTESIPEEDVQHIQSVLKKITENLPMYLMHSLYHLRTSKDFYPRLDIKKLYQITTAKKFQENTLQSFTMEYSDSDEESSLESSDEDEDIEKYLEARRSKRRSKRHSSQQTDISKIKGFVLTSKIQNLSDNRAKEVLKYFADHFIEIARLSNEFKVYNQAFKYLLLTENLCTLLKDFKYTQEARHYKEITDKIKIVTRNGLAYIKKMQTEADNPKKNTSYASRDSLTGKSKIPINFQQYMEGQGKNQKTTNTKTNHGLKKVSSKPINIETIYEEESESDDEVQITAC